MPLIRGQRTKTGRPGERGYRSLDGLGHVESSSDLLAGLRVGGQLVELPHAR